MTAQQINLFCPPGRRGFLLDLLRSMWYIHFDNAVFEGMRVMADFESNEMLEGQEALREKHDDKRNPCAEN